MSSRHKRDSVSYNDMLQAEQRVRYLGVLPENPGKLPPEAIQFLTEYPLVEINTGKLFDCLSYIYDDSLEKQVYEDIILAIEKSTTIRN